MYQNAYILGYVLRMIDTETLILLWKAIIKI